MRFRAPCLVFVAASLAVHAAPLVSTVDATPDVGEYTSLQLDGGNPVVSYYDGGAHDLKLATCVAGCLGSTPTWIITTVDAAGDVGKYSSLQLNGGNPVIAYFDAINGHLKLATCAAACKTATPAWVIVTVDQSNADVGRFPSLQLSNGNPVIAYRDRANGDLKLATCTAACATASPAWTFVAVDSAGNVGTFPSMKLIGDRPVIAYTDFGAGYLKLATCTAACASASPSWIIAIIDTVPHDQEQRIALQLDGTNPVIAYYEQSATRLKLATCAADCATAAPTWIVVPVDAAGDAGEYSSMQLVDGKPVIAYSGALTNCFSDATSGTCTYAIDLRLAICTTGCATASPTWVVSTVDNAALDGYDPSLQMRDGAAIVSYYDLYRRNLKVASVTLAEASIPVNHTALWWNFEQSGWGVNFAHQGDIVFGTLFTYDTSGAPMWLVLPAGQKQDGGAFIGTLYRTTGPAFDANPFTPIGPSNITPVGTMSVTFAGDSASLAYTADGATVAKTIRKQVFAAHAADCRAATGPRTTLSNYTDLWWNPAESGWGINLTHQGDIVFGTLFTYDANARGMWLVLPAGARQSDGSFLGDLYRTTGPAFNTTRWAPLTPDQVIKAGTMQLRFADGENGTLSYSVDGVSVQKPITRQVFSSPAAACTS